MSTGNTKRPDEDRTDQRTTSTASANQPHGIVAHLSERKLTTKTIRMGKPVVDIACAFSDIDVPVVDVDHRAVGVLAAEHFLERGFRHFGYYGASQVYYSQLREAAFRKRLVEAGNNTFSSCYADCLCYSPRHSDWQTTDRLARQWIEKLPKPVAIFAVDDTPARNLADICRLSGIRVPEDVALLGVDNDDMECHFAIPPLSSVVIPSQQIGWDSAQLLDRMMNGKSPSPNPVFHPPVGVAVRQSTDVFAIEDQEVAAALAFIRNNAADAIRIDTLAYEVGIARRTLEATSFASCWAGRSSKKSTACAWKWQSSC